MKKVNISGTAQINVQSYGTYIGDEHENLEKIIHEHFGDFRGRAKLIIVIEEVKDDFTIEGSSFCGKDEVIQG